MEDMNEFCTSLLPKKVLDFYAYHEYIRLIIHSRKKGVVDFIIIKMKNLRGYFFIKRIKTIFTIKRQKNSIRLFYRNCFSCSKCENFDNYFILFLNYSPLFNILLQKTNFSTHSSTTVKSN